MLSKRLENLHPYVPGEQPKDREYLKINANENPYPPHKSVAKAVKKALNSNLKNLGVYPDPDANELRLAISQMLNSCGGVLCNPKAKSDLNFQITPDMIFCGNGSDEVLSFVFYTFFDSDRPLILPKFTYSFYPVYCGFYNIPMEQIDLKTDWTLNTQKMLEEANRNNSNIIFANPNAPTGISLSRDEIKQMLLFAPKDRIFVVDEAYADFGDETCIPLLKEFENLVIVRTFSKSLSFAGQRLGYIVANPEIIKAIFTVKNSFNHFPVDFLTQTAGIASCKAVDYYAENTKKIVEQRKSLIEFLKANGWFVIDSKTNFVFTKKDGRSGEEIYQKVKSEGILIRHFATPGIEDFVRITIGTKKQMDKLKNILLTI